MLALLAAAVAAATPGPAPLRPELAAFAPLVGNCFRGEMGEGKSDTHCFSAVFDGQHLRDEHGVPGTPPYRGETIYSWNDRDRRIDWLYVNSLGMAMHGSATAVAEGIAFTLPDGDIAARWRWNDDGSYTVIAGTTAPVRFVRVKKA